MTQQTLILPYRRRSPLYIPRRDLVLFASDSLSLRVTVVESDDPTAMALELSGGLGGPALTLLIWRDSASGAWDYGIPPSPGGMLWTGTGTIADAAGSFDVFIAAGALADLPSRCGWAVRLDWGGNQSELLAYGTLHVERSQALAAFLNQPLHTDDSEPVLEDDGDPILVG